ncbi:unnamed protein product, partial [Timema podura]|nr:unnamed protein product [Timema podura]
VEWENNGQSTINEESQDSRCVTFDGPCGIQEISTVHGKIPVEMCTVNINDEPPPIDSAEPNKKEVEIKLEETSTLEERCGGNIPLADSGISNCTLEEKYIPTAQSPRRKQSEKAAKVLCEKRYRHLQNVHSKNKQEHKQCVDLCSFCGRSFRSSGNLKKHILRVHTENPPRELCNICGKTYTNLKIHLLTHSEQYYKCSECGHSSKWKQCFINHLRVHSSERPISCSFCDKSFKDKKKLNQHIRTHTGEMPYMCKHCGRSFSRRWNHIQHVRLHTGAIAICLCGVPAHQDKYLEGPIKLCHIVMVSKNFETHSRNNEPFQESTPEFFNVITTEEPDVSAFCEVTLTAIDDTKKTNLENKNKMIQSKKSKTNTIKKKVKICKEKGALNNKTTKKPSKRRVKRKRTCVDANESIVLRNFASPKSSGPSSSTSDPVPVQDKRHTCHICLKSYASRHSLTEHMAWHSGIKTFFCPVCEKGYYSATQLRTHARTHSSIRPYLCNICGKSYKLDSDLKRHSFIHSELSPYLCNICGKTTNSKSELNVHIQLHSNEKKYLCSDCGRAFKLRSVLKKHSAVHSPEKPEVCKVCDMSFKRKEYLERHMRIHTGENPYICKFCGRAFSGKWNMIQHVRLHTGVKPYVCNVCGEAFTHNVTLRKHAEKHKVQLDTQHLMPPPLTRKTLNKNIGKVTLVKPLVSESNKNSESIASISSSIEDKSVPKSVVAGHCKDPINCSEIEPLSSLSSPLFHCSKCPKTYDTHQSLMNHMSSHMTKVFVCTECDKCFSNAYQLKIHAVSHSADRPYSCAQCGKCFKTYNKLSQHAGTHSDYPRHRCDVCGKSFKAKSILNSHRHVHSSDKDYLCTECGKAFKWKRVFVTHLKVHSAEKPLKCATCNKAFKRKEHLSRHMNIHTKENPFVCEFCGRSFSQSSNLTSHIRLHTGAKPFSCHVCGKAFRHRLSLKKHGKHHKASEVGAGQAPLAQHK